jgi:hypothetical protein
LIPRHRQALFELAGPQIISADQFAQQLNGNTTRLRHLRPALARALGYLRFRAPGRTGRCDATRRYPHREQQETAKLYSVELHALADAWQPDVS